MDISALKTNELKNQEFIKFQNSDSRAVEKDLSSPELMKSIFEGIKQFFKLFR